MVNIETIEQEILDLEKKDTSYAVIERLAWLYIVRDHLITAKKSEVTGLYSGSEFEDACSSVPIDSLIKILSEHFETIRLLYPREYDLIINKIRSL